MEDLKCCINVNKKMYIRIYNDYDGLNCQTKSSTAPTQTKQQAVTPQSIIETK